MKRKPMAGFFLAAKGSIKAVTVETQTCRLRSGSDDGNEDIGRALVILVKRKKNKRVSQRQL
jgi:hypothetical protein